jgi:hypothetical protein
MTLETQISGSEDKLLAGLHFAGRETASYVTKRELVTFAPQQASNFKPSGVRLIRFNLSDQQGWLDGRTLRLMMTIVNNSASPLIPAALSPASMFRRLRLIANGSAIIEDVELYGRCHQLFSFMLPPDELRNRISEEWGNSATAATLTSPGAGQQIAAGESRIVLCQLMSSFLNQGKCIPLSFLPVVLELELADVDAALSGTDINWHVERPQLLADVMRLDTALQNSYAKHLLDGKSLPLHYDGMYSMQAAIPNGSSQYTFPVVRGFTRLNRVYVTFSTEASADVGTFSSPLGGVANQASNDTFSWWVTVGSERYPAFDVSSQQESMYRLRQMHPGPLHIDTYAYSNSRFVTGQSLERVPNSASFTGMNTRSGSQLTLNFRNTGAITTIHVVLVFDQVADLSSAGVVVKD